MPLLASRGSGSSRGFGQLGKVAESLGRTIATATNSAIAIFQEDPTSPNGFYYMNIGDGRGISQYYVNFTWEAGPWVMVCNRINELTGDPATPGIFNNGSPTISPGQNSVLNTNFAGNGISEINHQGFLARVDDGNDSRVYFLYNSTARSIINTEFRDTSGESSTDTRAFSYFTASTVGAKIAGGAHVNTYSTGSVIELHHGGWNPGGGINFIMENNTNKSAGGGYNTSSHVGFGNGNQLGNGSVTATATISHFIKI